MGGGEPGPYSTGIPGEIPVDDRPVTSTPLESPVRPIERALTRPVGPPAIAEVPAPHGRSFSNQLYMEAGEINRSTDSSNVSARDPYSSRDSGLPNSLERSR